jgi:hypothetical protein
VAQPRPLPGPDRPAAARRRGNLLRGRPRWRPGRRARIALLVVGLLILLVAAASFLVDEPLRRTIESQMNERLEGYTARIEKLSFHPLGFGLTLYDVSFAQNAHPDPPIMTIARLDASVEWKSLLRAKLVANFRLAQPTLHVNLEHLREEAKDPTPVEDKGWQDAFEAIYPLKINSLVIVNGEATYVDPGPFKPLQITDIDVRAENIRNVHSREREYPSSMQLTARVFETGRLSIDGNADFLADPFPGVKANVALKEIPLDYFKPVTNRFNLTVAGGTLSAEGLVEYAPTIKVVDLKNAEITGVRIEYIHTPKNAGIAKKTTRTTAEATKKAAGRPDLVARIGQLRVTKSEVAVVNRTTAPPFRVSFTDVNLVIDHVSSRPEEGVGNIELRGLFMGSGRTHATMSFTPTPRGPDFDLRLELEDTDMTTMNPILRQYGKFDVVEGTFSLYSELRGRDGAVTGYVKPLFKDVKAYDPAQDRDKGFVKKLYERLVTGVSKLLKNPPREEVATKVDVQGRLDQPQTSTLQAIGNLLRNAFIKAILPGLEREIRSSR